MFPKVSSELEWATFEKRNYFWKDETRQTCLIIKGQESSGFVCISVVVWFSPLQIKRFLELERLFTFLVWLYSYQALQWHCLVSRIRATNESQFLLVDVHKLALSSGWECQKMEMVIISVVKNIAATYPSLTVVCSSWTFSLPVNKSYFRSLRFFWRQSGQQQVAVSGEFPGSYNMQKFSGAALIPDLFLSALG